jgi:cob(I)alamin adenosyltransferase
MFTKKITKIEVTQGPISGKHGLISKNHPFTFAVGVLEEMQAHIGLIYELLLENNQIIMIHNVLKETMKSLQAIQSSLLYNKNQSYYDALNEPIYTNIHMLKSNITEIQKLLPVLKHFILPIGSPLAAQIHIARTVCRRAERVVVDYYEFIDNTKLFPLYLLSKNLNLELLNFLADFLFELARLVAYQGDDKK